MTAVTHPVTGLPSKKGWLPTVREVHDACELAWEPIKAQDDRQKRIKEQFEAREKADKEEQEKLSLAELKAKHGPNWGLETRASARSKSDFEAPNADQLLHHYRHYSLAFKPKETSNDADAA